MSHVEAILTNAARFAKPSCPVMDGLPTRPRFRPVRPERWGGRETNPQQRGWFSAPSSVAQLLQLFLVETVEVGQFVKDGDADLTSKPILANAAVVAGR